MRAGPRRYLKPRRPGTPPRRKPESKRGHSRLGNPLAIGQRHSTDQRRPLPRSPGASRGPLTDARRSTIKYGEYARNQRNTRGQNRQYPLAPVARNLDSPVPPILVIGNE